MVDSRWTCTAHATANATEAAIRLDRARSGLDHRQRTAVEFAGGNLEPDELRQRRRQIHRFDSDRLLEADDAFPPEHQRHASVVTPGRAMRRGVVAVHV